MVTRTEILKVPVDSRDFEAFAAKFDAFRDAASQTPELFKAASGSMRELAGQVEKMDAAFRQQKQDIVAQNDSDKERFRRLRESDSLWTNMARSSSAMSKNVLDIGTSLLKWGSLLAGGALFGSLFGIDRLAHSIGDTRSASTGFGVSPSALQAFNVNFGGRGIDTNSLLASMTSMETDISKQGPWYALMSVAGKGGMPLSGDTAKDTLALLQGVRDLTKQFPKGQWGTMAGALNLPVDAQGIQRIGGMSDKEFAGMFAGFQRDQKSFGLNDRGASAWQDLSIQIERASTLLKDKFAIALVGLVPDLIKLSSAFGGLVTAFLGSEAVKDGIKHLSLWLKDLTGEINSGEMRKKFDELFSATGEVIKGFKDLVYAIHHPGEAAEHALADAAKAAPGFAVNLWHDTGKISLGMGEAVTNFVKGFFGASVERFKGTAAEQFSSRVNKYGGDQQKALADMALGEKQTSQMLHWYGDDWKLNLSPEQRSAMDSFAASLTDTKKPSKAPVDTKKAGAPIASTFGANEQMSGQSVFAPQGTGVTVLVLNATGGNAAVALSQLG
jgi:hypothetical protein